MDTATLKENFEKQIADTEKQIRDLEENLTKAREYKIKLQGGLETLGLLEEQPQSADCEDCAVPEGEPPA